MSTLGADGTLAPAVPVPAPGIALQRLIGFSGNDSVAVLALALVSGAIERLLDVRCEAGTPTT